MKKIFTAMAAALCVGVAFSVATADSVTASAAQLVYYRESLGRAPQCVLSLEEAKVKNMTEWDYCLVDYEEETWYFRGDGSATGNNNPEIRFVADGVQTVTTPYTLVPIEVGSFSFEYCIVNSAPASVVDMPMQNYIVQILGADGQYPIIAVDIEDDGDWHKITVTGTTEFYGRKGTETATYGDYKDNFCGFLFKMGGLDGEFMIKDIRLYDFSGVEIMPEVEIPDEGEGEDSGSSENTSSEESEEEDSSSLEVSSEEVSDEEESYNSAFDNVGTFESVSVSQNSASVSKKKGCGSFGVGAMTLGALAAAGVVLSLGKKKRK